MTKQSNATSPPATRRAVATQAPAAGRPKKGTRVATRRKQPDQTPQRSPAPADAATFSLQAECLVADAVTLQGALTSLVAEPEIVTLDMSAVRRIDTAALQVVAAFIRERKQNGREVRWHGTAPALAAAARLLGLASLLQLPAAAVDGDPETP
jgi:ABC-type transporter Mla MlaB component